MLYILKKVQNGKTLRYLLLLGAAVGVLLLLWGAGARKDVEEEPESTVYAPAQDELVIYREYLEKRIQEVCESVRGVENVTAIVTLDGGFSSEYATEWKDGDECYVIIGSGSSAQALFLSRQAPSIAGIGIVCRGAESSAVQEELTALLCATFRISSNRIHITSAK